MRKQEYSIAIPASLDAELLKFLIRHDEEELLFALWVPSRGRRRLTALVNKLIYPIVGDRQRHGNVSFNPAYFERVCKIAATEGSGIAFLHSHPGPGWQGMSADDIRAEQKIMGAVAGLTDLPLLGMTVGSDGTWSARMWEHVEGKNYERIWCHSVRSVGEALRINFNDDILPKPEYREVYKRTYTVWGESNHANLARLRVGIVGLGSVGSIVAETLARMGLQRFTLIDFDTVLPHNLDRLLGATEEDIGKLKVLIAERQIRNSATAAKVDINAVSYSIAEEKGYNAALDCDVLFSCVDRPRARYILNHFAYAHLIPVIDGGIEVRFKHGKFSGVDWQLQTVAPGRPCLACIKAFDPGDVTTEIEGKLDDPSYLKGLSQDHRFKRNENVFPFSANLASLEVLQFVALATNIAGITDFGIQRYRYPPGILEADVERICQPDCDMRALIAQGDKLFNLKGKDRNAEITRSNLNKV
ncbi:MAG: ThiF family adenylyltransferase [Deltaproteobacteria bacterium]|nr:ThiF family adenylyltransferase [Deltaproteobacteria bacterium]